MEADHSDKSIDDEPNSKRTKIEAEPSTSSKPKTNDDCPISTLPPDILAKIIAFIPVIQWPALELLYDFRPATLIAWRQLRNVKMDRDFPLRLYVASVKSVLLKLAERSPFLTSLHEIGIRLVHGDYPFYRSLSEMVPFLARLEHLQSISLGDRGGILLEDVIEFLESTQSRTSLKELRIINVDQGRGNNLATLLGRFATSLVNGGPMALEKFMFTSVDLSLFLPLDTMDATRLTDVRLGKAAIEPQQLTDLIVRASNLRRIEFAFLHCRSCTGHRLRANKNLLEALASHERLTAIMLDSIGYMFDTKCMDFEHEFIQMLKSIGLRGQLRKLSLDDTVAQWIVLRMDAISATIRDYMPYLRSIKLNLDGITNDLIGTLNNIEEIYFTMNFHHRVTANLVEKISQLPRLKRLAVDKLYDKDPSAFECLADATSLTDLRIRNVSLVSADVFEKWSEGFASSLEILMLWRIAVDEDDHAEGGLVRLLEKAVRLRIVILGGYITYEMVMAIAKSCPQLEIFGIRANSASSDWDECIDYHVQEINDHCSRSKRLGGIETIRNELQFPENWNIGVEMDVIFWKFDFDDDEYD